MDLVDVFKKKKIGDKVEIEGWIRNNRDQATTNTERTSTNARHTRRNNDGGQATTTIERIIPNASHLIMSSSSTTSRPYFIEVDRTFCVFINSTFPFSFINLKIRAIDDSFDFNPRNRSILVCEFHVLRPCRGGR